MDGQIVIGIYQVDEECFHRKEQIVNYLSRQNIAVVDLSLQFDPSKNPQEDMRQAANMVKSGAASKGILLCKSARTATNVALEAGIAPESIAIQDQTPLKEVFQASLLTMGYSFDWESTEHYLDVFFDNF